MQLADAPDLPGQDVLQNRISSLFERMGSRARSAGIPEDDITDARYALAAFIDEQILRSSWPGRQGWMSQPLQLIYFNENTAGEGFFHRLETIQTQPHRAHVLQIYFLCMALGFKGRYAVRGSEQLGALVDNVGSRVAHALPPTDPISPNGEPRDAGQSFVKRQVPVLALSIGVVGLAIVIFFVLKLVVGFGASSAASKIQKFAEAQASAAKANP
jgi:type VI secretion system protein ImpK